MADHSDDNATQDDSKTEPDSPNTTEFPVVGIGASAGGLEALELFFDNMPATKDMAFVVVQHLSPDFKSLMDELLARHTSMPIFRVESGMRIEPGGIYLIPPKKNMVLEQGCLILTDQDSSGGLNLPIDIFFRSLAFDCGQNGIAVVLSGTGSDGSRGINDVHEAGGLVISQSVESAGFDGMPRNSISTGVCKVICKPQLMPDAVCRYVADPDGFMKDGSDVDSPVSPGGELEAIFSLFRAKYGLDFTQYREGTIERRIERRMQLVRSRNLLDYVQVLRENKQELDVLYRDLLVEVTEFFRDTQAFERLRDDIIPKLLSAKAGLREEFRAWVAGCATGEEAYSIAILLNEELESHDHSPVVKIFATDIHRSSLEAASAGVYSPEALAGMPTRYREKYFRLHGSLYHVSAELRKMVIFAPHNLVSDPPFTRLDLVTCRNVLIYLKPEVQQRIIALFHFGLRVDGCLMLGSSETVGDLAREFVTVDQHWRIFQKTRDVRLRQMTNIALSPALTGLVQNTPVMNTMPLAETSNAASSAVLEDLLEKYVPPSFLVDSNFQLVHSFGDTRSILLQPRGRPTLEIIRMVEGDLRMALHTALHRVVREKATVALQGVRVPASDGQDIYVRVVVDPYKMRNEEMFLVHVEEQEPEVENLENRLEDFHADDHAAQRIVDLERELEFKKESLQTTVEELESSNEELQSTNEELVSSNEELQSANEELHSVNEELYTVNAEHQRKIDELTSLTADMDNLIRSTDIGTLFLDRNLCIRRFTPSITSAFEIMEQDIGRPIHQFAYNLDYPDLIGDAKEVIETGRPLEKEIKVREGKKVFLKRMRPYRNAEGMVDGLVITFTDISMMAVARREEKRRREHLERVSRDLQDFAYAVSHDLHTPLRHLKATTTAIAKAYDADDDQIRLANQKVEELQAMLDSLLEYSRVNTRGGRIEEVDVNAVLEFVINDLKEPIETTQAMIIRQTLPRVLAAPRQLGTALQQIIDNALKYVADKPPKIVVSGESDDEFATIAIKDNGIGIKESHWHEVFVIFRRLGFVENVAGAGVGLAIANRILDRFGGRIWVEGREGEGSTFFVRLPLAAPVESA
ncbi:MAG: CheR family methyltransferase [Pirellulaceae bacterium]